MSPQSILVRERETAALSEQVQVQQLALVKFHSALAGYTVRQVYRYQDGVCLPQTDESDSETASMGKSTQERMPYQVRIRLGRDAQQRRAVLARLKQRKLHAAHLYLTERLRCLDPCRPFEETTRFEVPSGDDCALHFNIVPFEGATSVKQVYDALIYYCSNLEIRVTEILGDVMVREDDGGADSGILHGRMLSYLASGAQMEMNSVFYMHYDERGDQYGGGGRPVGIVTSDFVDEDEMYPYLPSQRVRQDAATIITVQWRTRTVRSPSGEEGGESVVAMTRSCFLKLHKSELDLPRNVMWALRDHLGKWGDVMLETVRELVYQPHGDSEAAL